MKKCLLSELNEMLVEIFSWTLVVLILKGDDVYCSSPDCDSVLSNVSEGVLGQTKTFPWVGVLRVHIHEGKTFQIALTGIVLVKVGYAIGNAEDVSKIPKRIFQEDSKAMFIPRDEEPWTCKVKDYMTHPEYQYETISTIALIELDLGEQRFYPMPPICWPAYSYNASDQLYAVGFTDENKLLEKLIYKLQYVDQSLCKEFYNRAGLEEGKKAPTHFQCGFAQNNKDNCVWDNGMALISNASGYWTLIGIGLHGPGCAAPARFIDLLPYYQWVDSATDIHEVDDYIDFRRSAFNEGFKSKKKPKEGNEDIPIHNLLRQITWPEKPKDHDIHDINKEPSGHNEISVSKDLTPPDDERLSGKQKFAHYYPFPATTVMGDMFSIQRINNSEIELIRIEDGQHGNCSSLSNRVIYKDYFKINMPVEKPRLQLQRDQGTVTYRLSMYDFFYRNYTCVKVKVVSSGPETAYLYYSTNVNEFEDILPDNPEENIRIYPITPNPLFTTTVSNLKWRPGYNLRPKSPQSVPKKYLVHNLNLFIRIDFVREGKIEVKVFGPLLPYTSSTSRPTTTRTVSRRSTEDPYALKPLTNKPPRILREDSNSNSETVEEFESYYRNDEFDVEDIEEVNLGCKFRCTFGLIVMVFLILFK